MKRPPVNSPEWQARLKRIRLLALDSDGVLTDGGVYVAEDGSQFRRFDIKDGAGLRRVMEAGLDVAVISSSPNSAVLYRCQQLGIAEVHVGITDKLSCLRVICEQRGLELDEVCYLGDDLVDLPVLEAVGLSCAPADAIQAVLEQVDLVLSKPGGYGAVREICDLFIVMLRL